jgi:hypothetical protein
MASKVFLEVNLDEEELRKFLNTKYTKDPVNLWAYLEKRNLVALGRAKAQVGVKTGALQRSIRSYHLGNSQGQFVGLIADKSYARLHHEGSRSHLITPKESGGVLTFSKGARMVVTKRVLHPGTKPNRFLSDQLRYYKS